VHEKAPGCPGLGGRRTAWPACGVGGIFSEYGSPPDHAPAWIVPTRLTFFQNNVWSDNVYNGPSTFYAWNQGNADNPVSWTKWTGSLTSGDKCSSAQERKSGFCAGPFGQDVGSTYRSARRASRGARGDRGSYGWRFRPPGGGPARWWPR
jgi:hypothetical protein